MMDPQEVYNIVLPNQLCHVFELFRLNKPFAIIMKISAVQAKLIIQSIILWPAAKWWLKQIKSTNRCKSHNRNFLFGLPNVIKITSSSFTRIITKEVKFKIIHHHLPPEKESPSLSEEVKFHERPLRNVNSESPSWLTPRGGSSTNRDKITFSKKSTSILHPQNRLTERKEKTLSAQNF